VRLNSLLAALEAGLVTASALAMLVGYRAAKRKETRRHRRAMLSAFGLSALFLGTFVFRYVRYGPAEMRGGGLLKVVYYLVWFTHEPIAVVSVPLVVAALALALLGRFSSHREIAPVALALWMYAAVTGIALYALLYET
jgi:putative membrane protein